MLAAATHHHAEERQAWACLSSLLSVPRTQGCQCWRAGRLWEQGLMGGTTQGGGPGDRQGTSAAESPLSSSSRTWRLGEGGLAGRGRLNPFSLPPHRVREHKALPARLRGQLGIRGAAPRAGDRRPGGNRALEDMPRDKGTQLFLISKPTCHLNQSLLCVALQGWGALGTSVPGQFGED